MSTPQPWFLRSPQGRLLLWLGGATVLMLILAVIALMREAELSGSHFTPRPFYPGLDVKLVDAAAITIRSKMGTVDLSREKSDPKTQIWVVPAAHNYPANADRIHRLLLGLADLKAVEEKTNLPQWHEALDLVDPKSGGGAIEVSVKDSKGAELADLLVGKLRPGLPEGRPAVYVRDAHSNQTYLAAGDLPVDTERKDWLDGKFLDLDRNRIKAVTVTPASGPAYTVTRDKPETANFTLADLPKGREMLSETVANALGAAAVDVTLDDVRPASEINFATASRIAFETFDGLRVTLDVADEDNTSWVRLSAAGADAKSAAEAARLNAKTHDWAYAVPSWKAGIFRKPFDSLLKSPEKKEPAKPRR